MIPEVQVKFCISGTEISPNEITNLLGVSPTVTWHAGESVQGTKLRRKHNGWCFSTNLERVSDLAGPMRSLLQVLLPKSKTIDHICSEHGLECEISCVIYITDETPIVSFDQDIICALAELKTKVDIDIILTD